ncbi:hypothetical protein COU56_02035 [Candidatus Pacearchaeota archaeon CG10_big_fil_rev_8_21_14_0_10_31_9]|nr:MAG: hypothetical protein COU56_02035 [Candidatus Pacearchaeota archaeon CG10_big_fil_rev_8_21_14_0_10_31_9]PIZ83148.1 MAG: hypothetical protein COX97_01585 [Candidatus Pacearchaeota archaeon CG_4_10_14_0_2_um_filter_05_32_18]
MESERSSVYFAMEDEINRKFSNKEHNDNSNERRKAGKNLRNGLVALSIGVGIFGNISGCNSYLSSCIYPRQETIIEDKNNLPSRNYPIKVDELLMGITATCLTYTARRVFLSIVTSSEA